MKRPHAMLVSLALVLGASCMLSPSTALAQEFTFPVAIGDTVEFAVDLGEYSGAWIGTVHEVKNPRDCIFVVHDKILRGDVFSMGIRFPDTFVLQVHSASDGTRTVDARTLREHGIDCIETHRTPEPLYLNPKEDGEGS